MILVLINASLHTSFYSLLKSFSMHYHWSLMINLEGREIMMKKFTRSDEETEAQPSFPPSRGDRMAVHTSPFWFCFSFVLPGLPPCANPSGQGWETFKEVELTLPWLDLYPLKSAFGQPSALPWSASLTAGVSDSPPAKEPGFEYHILMSALPPKLPFPQVSTIVIDLLSFFFFWPLLSWPRYWRSLFI